jgi:formylmethanofuran dehydrogenase subunit A
VVVIRKGEVVETVHGRVLAVRPDFDQAIERRLASYHDAVYGVPHTVFDVPEATFADCLERVPCRS